MTDFELTRFLLSIVLLLFFSLSIGQVFSLIGLPRVVGEICAGLALGPSLLGFLLPDLFEWIFFGFSEQKKLLSAFYWLGLIFLMFTAGFNISAKFTNGMGRLISLLILGGLGLPFLAGLAAAHLIPNSLTVNPISFALVMAAAFAVTSIPVLTRIFMDLDMLSTRFAQAVLSAAAIQDLILWVALSIALSIQQGQAEVSFHISDVALILVGTLCYGLVALLLFPLLLRYAGRFVLKGSPDASFVGYTILVCLFLVTIASLLRVNVVFSALLAGIVIGMLPEARLESVKQNITSLAAWFFVPIYFSLVGLQMNIPDNFDALLIFGFLFGSSAIKIVSVALFSRFAKISWSSAFDYGVTMNARGGPGIVLASLAFASGIIDEAIFVSLVLVSIISSMMAGVWLKFRQGVIR